MFFHSAHMQALTRPIGDLLVLASLALFLPDVVAAQQPAPLQLDPRLQITQYIHDTWTVKEGLPQSSIFAFHQGHEGYLWIGTQGGLARFDGINFASYNTANTDALIHNEIRAFLDDPSGGFWIGTNGGLAHYEDGTFTGYTVQDGLSSNAVRSLARDRAGNVWIGTVGGGLNRFDGETFTSDQVEDGLAGNVVLSLQYDSTGTLWVGTQAGLSSYRNGELTTQVDTSFVEGSVVDALHLRADGSLWVGTNRGLARLEGDSLHTFTTETGLCSNNISALIEDAAGALWIGTLDEGLCRYYDGTFTSFSEEDGLTLNRIRSLHLGREGSLWIGTEMGGLNRLRMGKFAPVSTKEGLSSNVVYSVLQDREGSMWIGTLGGGLNRIDPTGDITHFTVDDGLPSNQVVALHETRDGQLWVGTQGGGACRLVKGTLPRFDCITGADGLATNYVFSIYEDRNGSLWVGTNGGLSRIAGTDVTTFTTDDGLSSNQVTALLEDASGNLWVGTYGGGLNRYRQGRFISYGQQHGLSSASVLTVHEGLQGMLWIGTQGGGLCRLRNGLFACFDTDDGLHSNDILHILEDDQGNLWLGGMKRIGQISKKQLGAYTRSAIPQLEPKIYGVSNGLKSSEMNGGTQPAAWRSRDGRLWFSSIRGVAVIDPAHIPVNPMPPPVKIHEFQVNGRTWTIQEDLQLPSGSRDFAFHYTGLSFAAPEQVQYEYKLEGYDNRWVEAGNRRDAFYTNLSPGEYTFHVRARNNDGVWNRTGASMAFYVEPYFYETYWFYLLCVLGVGLAVVGSYRVRLRQLKTRELKQLVAEQTSELRAREAELKQLNSDLEQEVQNQLEQKMEERRRYERQLIEAKERAEASARLKASILQNMSHEIRTPITAILGYAQILEEELSDQMFEFASHIYQNGERLLMTINSILDLSKMEANGQQLEREEFDLRTPVQEEVDLLASMAQKKGIDLRADLPPQAIPVCLNKHAITRILQNLVGNAIKFTDEGEVVVEAGVESGGTPYFKVKDTGIGISEEFLPRLFNEFEQESSGLTRSHEGTGLGMAITKRLADALDGQIDVESEKGKGTVFTITFPGALHETAPVTAATTS